MSNDNDEKETEAQNEIEGDVPQQAQGGQEVDMSTEEGLQQVREQIEQYHDMLDAAKAGGEGISQQLQEIAQEEEDQEQQMEYMQLASAAMTVYQRIENGDSSVRRGGL